jgi:hypothetical protein
MSNDKIPNDERMTKPEARSPKPEGRIASGHRRASSLVIRHSFVIRHWELVIKAISAGQHAQAIGFTPTLTIPAPAESGGLNSHVLDFHRG